MFSSRSLSISRWDRLNVSTQARRSLGTILPRIGQPGNKRLKILFASPSQTVSLSIPLDEFAIQEALEPVVEEVLDDGFLLHVGMSDNKVTPPWQQITTAGVRLHLDDLEDLAHAFLEVDPTFRRPKLGSEQVFARRRDCPLPVALFDQIVPLGDDARSPQISRVDPVTRNGPDPFG